MSISMKRYGESVRYDVQYTPRPGSYGVIMGQKQIMLTHQSMPKPELQLPGGGIDFGESALQALHRECLEETGWKIQIDCRLGAYQRYTYMPEYDLWAQKICHIFLCRPVLKLQEPSETFHSVVWANPYDALSMLSNDGDCAYLEAVLRQY